MLNQSYVYAVVERGQIMNKAPDRKKLRREYLKRKASAYTRMAVGGTLFVPFVFAACLFAAFTLVIIAFGIEERRPEYLFATLVVGAITAFLTWLAHASRQTLRRGRMQSQIPYVPPVTPNTLPADEILVRAAEEPLAAQSEVLLRAAKGQGHETAKEELLRVSQE
jgi:hypothetical protein